MSDVTTTYMYQVNVQFGDMANCEITSAINVRVDDASVTDGPAIKLGIQNAVVDFGNALSLIDEVGQVYVRKVETQVTGDQLVPVPE